MIIGITGYYASGKDTVAAYLEGKGFVHYSLSDEIREEARQRGIKLTREHLIQLGNLLRTQYGTEVWARKVMQRFQEGQNYVISSIRNPGEVAAFKEREDFILIAIEADLQKRFALLQQRIREEDPKSLRDFIETEKIEESADPTKQQLHLCQKMAKIVIKNDGTLEELYQKIDRVLQDLKLTPA